MAEKQHIKKWEVRISVTEEKKHETTAFLALSMQENINLDLDTLCETEEFEQ